MWPWNGTEPRRLYGSRWPVAEMPELVRWRMWGDGSVLVLPRHGDEATGWPGQYVARIGGAMRVRLDDGQVVDLLPGGAWMPVKGGHCDRWNHGPRTYICDRW